MPVFCLSFESSHLLQLNRPHYKPTKRPKPVGKIPPPHTLRNLTLPFNSDRISTITNHSHLPAALLADILLEHDHRLCLVWVVPQGQVAGPRKALPPKRHAHAPQVGVGVVEVDDQPLLGSVLLTLEHPKPEDEMQLVTAHQVHLAVDEVQDVLLVLDRRAVVVPLDAVETQVAPLLLAAGGDRPIAAGYREGGEVDRALTQVQVEDRHQVGNAPFLGRQAVEALPHRQLAHVVGRHHRQHWSLLGFHPRPPHQLRQFIGSPHRISQGADGDGLREVLELPEDALDSELELVSDDLVGGVDQPRGFGPFDLLLPPAGLLVPLLDGLVEESVKLAGFDLFGKLDDKEICIIDRGGRDDDEMTVKLDRVVHVTVVPFQQHPLRLLEVHLQQLELVHEPPQLQQLLKYQITSLQSIQHPQNAHESTLKHLTLTFLPLESPKQAKKDEQGSVGPTKLTLQTFRQFCRPNLPNLPPPKTVSQKQSNVCLWGWI